MTTTGGTVVHNQLWNLGTLRSADLDSVVVRNDDVATLVISNMFGTFTGSLDLSSAHAQYFNNTNGGVVELGTRFSLGGHASSAFENVGTMTAGALGGIATSLVTTGRFTQTSSGRYQVDAIRNADASVQHDRIDVALAGHGGKVELGGTLSANWLAGTVMPDQHQGYLTVMTTTPGSQATIDISGLTAQNTATVTYTPVLVDDNGSLRVNYSVDYSGQASGATLSENARSFASYYTSAIAAIGSTPPQDDLSVALQQMSAQFLNARDGAELEARYREHSAAQSLTSAHAAVNASQALHTLLQSCPTLDTDAGDDFFRQRDCVWMQAIGNRHFQDRTATTNAFREDTTGLAGAFQKEVFDDTFVEIGGRFEQVEVSSSGFAQSGTRLAAGVALKRELGPLTLSGTLGGGVYDLDQTRRYTVGATAHVATADVKGSFLTAEGRVSALFAAHGFYAKPAVALSVTRLWQDGYSETGTGPLNWAVGGLAKTSVAVSPQVELGHAFDLAERPTAVFLRAGLTAQLTDPEVSTQATLAGADAGLGGVTSSTSSDRLRADFAAGFDMDVSERFSVSLLGQAGFSENTTDFGGYARFKLRF